MLQLESSQGVSRSTPNSADWALQTVGRFGQENKSDSSDRSDVGHAIKEGTPQSPLYESADPAKPPLKCISRAPSVFNRKGIFVVVSCADPSLSLPLGKHFFKVAAKRHLGNMGSISRSQWFAAFRFTGGLAVTKHFEGKRLLERRRCIWSRWGNEALCSSACGK